MPKTKTKKKRMGSPIHFRLLNANIVDSDAFATSPTGYRGERFCYSTEYTINFNLGSEKTQFHTPEISTEIINHESIHLVLSMIDEEQASFDFDKLYQTYERWYRTGGYAGMAIHWHGFPPKVMEILA